ncbi:tetratricopeptide repeat-containing sensor histidine kinase [Pinibacter aurantiacus]|uniref:histidine kinase n=1 Tax=Pinibacter aurantiacus TaxID=2851599 RepID=A0A9E2SFV7_9BACT|nr:sensor histidine kinase [Pinibacter aurantiacus]MBV4360485.1 sensor histidine kinase [Pinibacter aurantiacus]
MRKLLPVLTILFTVCFYSGRAQSFTKNDSLRNSINKATTDSLKVEALYEYMKANLNNNTSDFEPYIQQMIFLSRKINFKWGLSTAYILGLSYHKNRGEFEQALKYADSATVVAKGDTAEDLRLNMGHISLNRGNLYYNIGDYETALKDYYQAEKVFRQIRHKSLASTYSNISNCFMSLSDHSKAITYSRLAVATAKSFDDNRLLATDMMNLATAYMNIDDYNAADSLLGEAWPIVEQLKNLKSFHVYYYNMGDLATYKKDTVKALEYYRKSYEYAMQNEDVWQQGKALDVIINCQMDLRQRDAKINIDKLYLLAEENGMDDNKAAALQYYSRWYADHGDYKKAYAYEQQFRMISDSMLSNEIKEKASLMDVRFRVAGKEQEIKDLTAAQKIQQLSIRQKNIVNYIFATTIIALVIISLLIYRNYRHRQKLQQAKIEELQTEKKLAAAEAVIKGEEQERTRIAKDLHDGLGGMLSGIKYSLGSMKQNLVMTPDNAQAFERSIDMLDSSIGEMRRVAHNMMPEVLLKYGLDTALREFCNDINRSGAISIKYQSLGMNGVEVEQTTAITVYRVIQELVNNVLKHAHAQNLLVQLHFAEQENILAITVEDDGKGFNMEALDQTAGMGWKSIQNRVKFLKGKIDVQASQDKGTSVMIEIGI